MKNILFLEGDIQIGKSSIILNNLISHKLIEHTTGFLCQRLTEEGISKAFCLIPAEKAEATVKEYKSNIPNTFLEEVSGKWIRKDEVFLTKGIELLKNVPIKRLVLLDEIGGFELLIDGFREKLYEVLQSDTPIIGVIKSNKNAAVMKNAVGIYEKYYIIYEKFRSDINDFGGKIINLNTENIRKVDDEIKSFLSNI